MKNCKWDCSPVVNNVRKRCETQLQYTYVTRNGDRKDAIAHCDCASFRWRSDVAGHRVHFRVNTNGRIMRQHPAFREMAILQNNILRIAVQLIDAVRKKTRRKREKSINILRFRRHHHRTRHHGTAMQKEQSCLGSCFGDCMLMPAVKAHIIIDKQDYVVLVRMYNSCISTYLVVP